MRWWRVPALAVAASVCFSCSHRRAPSLADPVRDAGADAAAGSDAGLQLDDAGMGKPSGPCGAESIPAISTAPNLSFIIDHSASMGDELAGSGLSKYENARIALWHVLKAVGHRVNWGVMIFPGLAGKTGCEAGDELMPVAPGDPASFARSDTTGPRLKDMLGRLSIAAVDGGTPAAASLSKQLATLQKLEGKTYVVLVTDGAPNCNADLTCAAAGCIPNIEGLSVRGESCTDSHNCCAPTADNPAANLLCVDARASLDAVEALADAGIATYVVGMPGSEPYQQLLSDMAEAGGTARSGSTKYYSVADTDALEAALRGIAASVAISCDIPLDYEPPDRDYVNVYFDGELVEYDPVAGWEWTDSGHVAIRGDACEQLSSGNVVEVQVLAGCKTVVK